MKNKLLELLAERREEIHLTELHLLMPEIIGEYAIYMPVKPGVNPNMLWVQGVSEDFINVFNELLIKDEIIEWSPTPIFVLLADGAPVYGGIPLVSPKMYHSKKPCWMPISIMLSKHKKSNEGASAPLNKKVIFVGMHNKPHKTPLCSSTKSGKLIDRIIEGIKPIQCIKTNLYDVDYYPTTEDEKHRLARGWHPRIQPQTNDTIVLLGDEVHRNFTAPVYCNIVKIPHPSSMRSHVEMDGYVLRGINAIKTMLPK